MALPRRAAKTIERKTIKRKTIESRPAAVSRCRHL
jgi:hypothetical protein